VEASEFDEEEFFRAIAGSGARALLIGRRALVALGLPVLTADYDFWLHIDEIWTRRRGLEVAPGVTIAVPVLDDLILTKRFGGRPKDLEDIRLLETLRKEEA